MVKTANRNIITGIVFSKDRALQLDGTLRSFKLHAKDLNLVDINILYTTSTDSFAQQYRKLIADYPEFNFIKEKNFHEDFLDLCRKTEYLLFLVDDNIFVRQFGFLEIIEELEHQPGALAFSLRLGKNNTHFYMIDKPQKVPLMQITNNPEIFFFDWTKSESDFAFPIEVSSSVYRTSDLWPFLNRIEFTCPNNLEQNIAPCSHHFQKFAPLLLCYQQAVTFCNPINIVNTVCRCRAGNRQEYSSDSLNELFAQGFRIDVQQYRFFSPSACHQEVELKFRTIESLRNNALTDNLAQSLIRDKSDALENARKLKKTFSQLNLQSEAGKVYETYLQEHPEDSELIEALSYWEKSASDTSPKIPTVSIIIPAYNCSSTITKSLDSICSALKYCNEIIPGIDGYNWAEIIVINDNSNDQTEATVTNYNLRKAQITLFNNQENLGAGPSRNRGVRYAKNDLILFLDGDDLFFREHIFLCLHSFIIKPWLHFVQTGIRIDEEILPYWEQAVENSVPFNICVRRWCLECLGGFPEDKAFQSLRCEDVFFRVLLKRYFLGHKIRQKTIHHLCYPGNALDRQLDKFSRPPTETCSEEILTDEEIAVFPEIKQIMAEKNRILEHNFNAWAIKLKG